MCSPDGCGTIYQLLLLHKPRKRDAWQLPQGGVEAGESIEQAAVRELREEAGVEARTFGRSSRVYRYDFPQSFRRLRPDNVKGQTIEYVFALIDPGARIVVDEQEIDAYAWLDIGQLPQYIQRKEYLELVKELYDEAVTMRANKENRAKKAT